MNTIHMGIGPLLGGHFGQVRSVRFRSSRVGGVVVALGALMLVVALASMLSEAAVRLALAVCAGGGAMAAFDGFQTNRRLRALLATARRRGGSSGRGRCGLQATEPKPRCEARSVLIAEDTVTNQLILRGMMEKEGFRVDVVADGVQAVAAVAAGHYDLVLMDIAMPRMDGLEASRRIRVLPGSQRLVPIVAVTASLTASQRGLCFDAGMNDCLLKPFSTAALRDVIAASAALVPTSESAPLVDDATLTELCGEIDPEMVSSILVAFVGDVENRLGRMTAAAATANLRTLAFESHAVSSCSRTFGALRLARLCHDIEHAVEDGSDAEALALAGSLAAIGGETLNALSRYRPAA